MFNDILGLKKEKKMINFSKKFKEWEIEEFERIVGYIGMEFNYEGIDSPSDFVIDLLEKTIHYEKEVCSKCNKNSKKIYA